MRRKRRLKSGDLSDLRRVLWRTIVEVESLLDTRPPSNDLVLKSAHALAQLAGAYTKLVETADLETRLATLEATLSAEKRP
jgi:hypothetical protein